jgi:hypothetical protein
MINYVEKGTELHQAIRQVGYWLKEENGIWISSDDVAVQQIIDSFNPIPSRQDAKWEEIKTERDRRQVLGVVIGTKKFHSDPASRIQQLGLVLMGANIPVNLQWKTMDGSFVSMTPTLAEQIFSATASSDQAIFAAAEVHKANMMASANPQTYDFSNGWPT